MSPCVNSSLGVAAISVLVKLEKKVSVECYVRSVIVMLDIGLSEITSVSINSTMKAPGTVPVPVSTNANTGDNSAKALNSVFENMMMKIP